MKFGYFFEGTNIALMKDSQEAKMRNVLYFRLGIPVASVVIFIMILGVYMIRDTTNKITRGVINLYETLETITKTKK